MTCTSCYFLYEVLSVFITFVGGQLGGINDIEFGANIQRNALQLLLYSIRSRSLAIIVSEIF